MATLLNMELLVLIACSLHMAAGLGNVPDEFGCQFKENYNVDIPESNRMSQEKWKKAVWGDGTKIQNLYLPEYELSDLLNKTINAKKAVFQKYHYDETIPIMAYQERRNKTKKWVEWLAESEYSPPIDTRQDNLGIMMKLFKQIFKNCLGSKFAVVNQACYFAAIGKKFGGKKGQAPEDNDIDDFIGVMYLEVRDTNGRTLEHGYIPIDYFEKTESEFQKGAETAAFKKQAKLKETQRRGESIAHLKDPLCSIVHTANKKMASGPFLFAKLNEKGKLKAYVLTKLDDADLETDYCKGMRKGSRFCIGYVDGGKKGDKTYYTEKTYYTVESIWNQEEDQTFLNNVSQHMECPIEILKTKLSALDDFVANNGEDRNLPIAGNTFIGKIKHYLKKVVTSC